MCLGDSAPEDTSADKKSLTTTSKSYLPSWCLFLTNSTKYFWVVTFSVPFLISMETFYLGLLDILLLVLLLLFFWVLLEVLDFASTRTTRTSFFFLDFEEEPSTTFGLLLLQSHRWTLKFGAHLEADSSDNSAYASHNYLWIDWNLVSSHITHPH